MSDTKLLKLTVGAFAPNQLDIKVENLGKALDASLLIEFTLSRYLVDKRIREAADDAPKMAKPRNMASLSGVVTGAQGFSVWAKGTSTDSALIVALLNSYDQKTGEKLRTPVKFDAGAAFTLRIPLDTAAPSGRVEIDYGYRYEGTPREDGKLELIPSGASQWKPDVTLTVKHESPTMINPGTEVRLSWHIKDGVSATLRGPLPGGNSEYTLSSDPESDFQMSDGSIEILVMGPATYLLQAEVRGPDNKTNEQVVRMLSLDTYTPVKYANVSVRPSRVLRHGLVEVDWAAWGVDAVTIYVSGTASRRIQLTEQNLTRTFQGTGVMRVIAAKSEEMSLEFEIGERRQTLPNPAKVTVVSWESQGNSKVTGRPIGLAVAAPKMAILTTDGLWLGDVGEDDLPEVKIPRFSKAATDTPKAWLAVAALDGGFLALRQTNNDALQLVSYKSDGKQDGLPLDLPVDLRAMARRVGTVFDLVAFGNRVYVVVEVIAQGGSVRRAYSVRLKPLDEWRAEPLLEPLARYRLLTFDDALYAVNRGSGRMFRFEQTKDGKLEEPRKAARAFEGGRSMIQQGLLIPVGRVLAVLNPSSVPSLGALSAFGILNWLPYTNLLTTKSGDETPQDLVYNPQQDHWIRCGRGLDAKNGALAAFREGSSPRLWVLQPEGEIHTLAVASEHLFAKDYVRIFPAKPLPSDLNARGTFTVKNETGMNLVPMNETCRLAGLADFISAGPAKVARMPNQFQQGATEALEFSYNKEDPLPITLRFLIKGNPPTSPESVLEMTFSGEGLSSVTSVFKRLAVDAQGTVSIAELPGTRVQHPTGAAITLPRHKIFDESFKLVIYNASTVPNLSQKIPPQPPVSIAGQQDVKVAYNTPDFSIGAEGSGELRVNVDFSRPPGIETSSGNVGQRSLIRINPDQAIGLDIRTARMLKPGDPPLNVDYRGGKTQVSATNSPVFVLQIGSTVKKDLNGICIGDGVANSKGDIYLPVVDPKVDSRTRRGAEIWKVDPKTFAITRSNTFYFFGAGIHGLPNSIGISNKLNKLFVMFDYNVLHELSLDKLELPMDLQQRTRTREFNHYKVVTSVISTEERIYMLGTRMSGEMRQGLGFGGPTVNNHYWLLGAGVHSDGPDICLDSVPGTRRENRNADDPAWVTPSVISPIAVSVDERRAAICIYGGVLVIDTRAEWKEGVKTHRVEVVSLESVGREEAILFNKGRLEEDRQPSPPVFPPRDDPPPPAGPTPYLFCIHSQPNDQGISVSRVNIKTLDNLRDKRTVSLAPGEGPYELITKKGGTESSGTLSKYRRAVSMVMGPNEKSFFVSHGRTIRQIDAESLSVLRSVTVELPCRLINVTQGPENTWLVYALGSTGTSDGTTVQDLKTHLYRIALLRSE